MANRRTRVSSRPKICFLLLLSLALSLLALASLHTLASILPKANALGRRCTPETLQYSGVDAARVKIAMVSFLEERESGRRSFGGLMEVVTRNKRAYAARMGYDFIDARELVDPRRPPSWSKIIAIRTHLRSYDWVFWNDADAIVTNPDVSLENILVTVIGHSDFQAAPDLILTKDVNGVNAGVFFVRRSEWSKAFLDKWWNQTSFIRFGSTKSGDNDAMKHLIDSLPDEELRDHVRISPMQCLFNSYPWFPTWKSTYRLISSPQIVWRGAYSNGDFMVHLAGVDDKKKWVAKILREIDAEKS